eukprot:SM000020S06093  [mRNA]  locus=s20:1086081:1086726:+ [translate_table: standard]
MYLIRKLDYNGLSGVVPYDILDKINLQKFQVAHNKLISPAPMSRQETTIQSRLTHIDLAYNNFTELFPNYVAAYRNLKLL